jgi:hypothetical protein
MAYSTINKYSDHFNTKLFTGNASADNAITGVGFQPDWVWLKDRVGTNNHSLYDFVRGVTKALRTSTNGAETTTSGVTAFGADGFTVGDNAMGNAANAMVAWCWKAANGAGSSNTDGSITSTVSVNTTAGFSIVSYTGTGSQATVGHGLGAVPKMIIIKRLQNTEDWAVYHASNGAGTYQSLNTTEAKQTNANRFNVAPTNQVFTVNTHESVNYAENYIAYCFAEISGYSKFSSYTGNGDADGAFVYTGFRPTMVICKRTSAADPWVIMDSKREGYNVANYQLVADTNGAESSNVRADLLSNGFKARSGSGEVNDGTYIYMAFGQPIISNSGVCATAR